MSENIKVYRLNIEFETEHDWNEMREVLAEWEEGGIEGWDGADSAFSTRVDILNTIEIQYRLR
tara:strand:+ start:551 stop:739 length:189 start_codon:yes stop_codon:yes gene_type:complete